MTKEKIQQKGVREIVEGGLAGPIAPSGRNLDSINIDNPPGTSQEVMGENFDSLAHIYSPDAETKLRIDYNKAQDGKETATVFIEGQQYYFTDSEKEVANFRSWSENKQKRKEAKNKNSN